MRNPVPVRVSGAGDPESSGSRSEFHEAVFFVDPDGKLIAEKRPSRGNPEILGPCADRETADDHELPFRRFRGLNHEVCEIIERHDLHHR
jgi:hypothetical protein